MTTQHQPEVTGLRLLVTGGTIDKVYHAEEGRLGFERTQLLAMLRQARVALPERCIETVLLKDSLDMDEADREVISAACRQAQEDRILITHGTDTMVLTAEYLARTVTGRTLVLTGAMVPYAVQHSDALFNFGFAFAAAQLLPAGVYVAMNGQVFPWNDVTKNRAAGWFERAPAAP